MIACFNIFLLLSVHPIGAVRTLEVQDLALELSRMDSTVRDLQAALHEDQKAAASGSHGDLYIGEMFASCDQRREDFNRRTEKVLKKVTEANSDGKVDVFEASGIILTARDVAKTLEKAQSKGCTWVQDKSVNRTVLDEVVRVTAFKNPCFGKAKEVMESASKGSAQEQEAKLAQAMHVLLSSKCEATGTPQSAPVAAGEPAVEALAGQLDEAADVLAEKAVDEAHQEKRSGKLGSLLELRLGLPEGSSLAEMEEQGGFDEIIGKAIGFLFLLIVWALFCWFFLAAFLALLGVVMCLLKAVIVSLLNIFKSDKWEVDLGGCLGWWMSVAGHAGSNEMAITMCAVSTLTSR